MGGGFLPPTPLRWTPSPALRPNPRSPVSKLRSLTTFPAEPCKTPVPQGGGSPSVTLGFFGLGFAILALKPRSPAFHETPWAHQPSNLEAQPSNLGAQPSNLGAQPSNLGAHPSNLEAQPSNLGAQPRKCGAQPCKIVKFSPGGLNPALEVKAICFVIKNNI